jgi:hypothetical protein
VNRNFSHLFCAKGWDPRDPFVYSWGKVAAETKTQLKMKNYENLVERTKTAMVERGVPVDVFVERDEETGRYYLCGRYASRMAFNGEVIQREAVKTEEIFRGDEDLAFNLFTMHFGPNRCAFLRATNEEVLEFGMNHPDTFPVEVAA